MAWSKKTVRNLLIVIAPLIGANPASADSVGYRYDALGRLTESCIYNSATQDGRDVDIAYDQADNRTNYKSILLGMRLNAGQTYTSPNGLYVLSMQSDGNLVLYGPAGAIWASNTVGTGSFVKFQGDGNLVVYNGAGIPVWASNTGGNRCARLQMQNDGNLVIVSGDNVAVWATNTAQ
ncbi:hypothetical protein [Sphingomonas bisphenolicum]|uniref:Bulb-type lectin domain-containing protein n=1 Tax=Sphingomonas bisphenolicum TaxID=296544 RepID=A0ABN5W7X2_9SPHN|nr:hypothetical protein [Sphingomonas bisphenolicum]BBF68408.1 hypothetical protein SBA_ch1_06080 [Sphingomonas bisphenolicum]